MSKKVSIDQPAPEFTLRDYTGDEISLSDFHSDRHVVLVFNRGFT